MLLDLKTNAHNANYPWNAQDLDRMPRLCRLTRIVVRTGQKKAREMWFLARFYDAKEALAMGLVNTVVPLDKLEEETLVW